MLPRGFLPVIAFAECDGIEFDGDAADLDRFSAHIGNLDGLGDRPAYHSRKVNVRLKVKSDPPATELIGDIMTRSKPSQTAPTGCKVLLLDIAPARRYVRRASSPTANFKSLWPSRTRQETGFAYRGPGALSEMAAKVATSNTPSPTRAPAAGCRRRCH